MESLIKKFNLLPHPEGGFFKEIYRSKDIVRPLDKRYNNENRKAATTIYYLLGGTDFSSFHQVNSDESWQYCSGSTLTLYIINKTNGQMNKIKLGNPLQDEEATYQYCIEEGQWFAAKPDSTDSYTLVTCTVSPGFEFQDWVAAQRNELIAQYPQHANLIKQFTRIDEEKAEEEAKLEDAKNAIGKVTYK